MTTPPPLNQFTSFVLSISGGKDSEAMIIWALRSLPRDKLFLIFADTGRTEWPETLPFCHTLARLSGLPLAVVRNEKRDLLEGIRLRGMWPDAARRYCTSDYKIAPIHKWVRNTSALSSLIAMCTGERAEESPRRAQKPQWERCERLCTRSRTVWMWRPLLCWKKHEVWTTIKEASWPHHLAYDRGMTRLSCTFCIFAPRRELAIAKRYLPELYQQYTELEKASRHLFRKNFAIADLEAEEEEKTNPQLSLALVSPTNQQETNISPW